LLFSGKVFASLGVISLEELTDRADLIVHGMVVSVESVVFEREKPERTGKLLISIATALIAPDRILKGSVVEPLIVKFVENMEDSPQFHQDQEVFLFLTQNKDGSSYSTFGLIQGKFDVSNGFVVRAQTTVNLFIQKLERLIHIPETD